MSITVINTENDDVNCPISLEPFENPVVLVNCGHTFSEGTIQRATTCPKCRVPISSPPVPNYALRDIMATKGEVLPTSEVYELFCVDVSSSMWFSDYFGPLSWFKGDSRMKIAQDFCTQISLERQKDESHKMGLIVFGTNVTEKLNFGTPREFRENLRDLSPIENRTRLFDAFETAVNHLNSKKNCEMRLYMLTDGGENFSSQQNTSKFKNRLKSIVDTTKRLKIATIVFNVGGDVDNVRKTAEYFHADFKHLDHNNLRSLAKNICEVSFPNREQQIRNMFQKVPTIPKESVMIRKLENNNNSSNENRNVNSPPIVLTA